MSSTFPLLSPCERWGTEVEAAWQAAVSREFPFHYNLELQLTLCPPCTSVSAIQILIIAMRCPVLTAFCYSRQTIAYLSALLVALHPRRRRLEDEGRLWVWLVLWEICLVGLWGPWDYAHQLLTLHTEHCNWVMELLGPSSHHWDGGV